MFIVNVEGAIFKDDKWLIGKRSEQEEHAGGELSLIGGKVEVEGFSSDILERTVLREIQEEVGLVIQKRPQYVYSTSFVTDAGQHVVNVVFLCAFESGKAIAKSPDEMAAIFWMTTDEILNNPKAPDYLKDSIRRAEGIVVQKIRN
ncbi:NUDIX domain-containing protein [Virgibacillus ndiopensis]|uniref:NUDIX domain-containing protein n=1 Tax=Virgibacillus ndiopensis TaxID=2004408 RepID=UPI000C07A036|nr:NUDIX domain-containing protein [Virgibacillus ndiopensis]